MIADRNDFGSALPNVIGFSLNALFFSGSSEKSNFICFVRGWQPDRLHRRPAAINARNRGGSDATLHRRPFTINPPRVMVLRRQGKPVAPAAPASRLTFDAAPHARPSASRNIKIPAEHPQAVASPGGLRYYVAVSTTSRLATK
jgi:hypothetical protein